VGLSFDAATIQASAEVARVLVSPLQYRSATEWRSAVHAAMRHLFAADQAMTIMSPGGELVQSDDLDTEVLRKLRVWFDEFTPEGRLTLSDPVVNEWNDHRRRLGVATYTRDFINHVIDERVLESPFVNEALIPNRMQYWQGLYATGPANSDALVWVSYQRRSAEPFGEAAVPLLSALAPAFQAGVDALVRLERSRAALDEVAQPLIVFDLLGRVLHRTASFDSLAGGALENAVVSRAHKLALDVVAALVQPRVDRRAPASATAMVATPSGHLMLRATLMPEGVFSLSECVAVLVIPQAAPKLPAVTELCATHGLTRREAEIALHLAAGASREQIARQLFISPYTVRSHTEKVFFKLGVNTRAAVALRILRDHASAV